MLHALNALAEGCIVCAAGQVLRITSMWGWGRGELLRGCQVPLAVAPHPKR